MMAAFSDALKLALAVRLALSIPLIVQLLLSARPVENETSCSIPALMLPSQVTRPAARGLARGVAVSVLTVSATRFMEPSGTACRSVVGTVETTVFPSPRLTLVTRPRKPCGVSSPRPIAMIWPFC